MANIETIHVRCWTRSQPDSGTDDNTYLGLGGREFHLDTSRDDLKTGSDQTFILGDGHNVNDAAKNDPRNPQLDDQDDLPVFPVYIRKAGTRTGRGDDAWYVERVDVTVNPGPGQIRYSRLAGSGGGALWLSNESGLILFLKRV